MAKDNARIAAVLLLQIAICTLYGAATALSAAVLSGKALEIAHGLGQWALFPCAGAWTAYRCVRKGVPAICAWPLPVITASGIYWLIVGFPPSAGASAICALSSLVGAAAGEVRGKWHKRERS